MDPVLEMHLEIIDSHFRPWRVQLTRTVFALDAWIVHVLDVFRWRRIWPNGDGQVGCGADGRIPHRTFEGIVWIVLLQPLEGAGEP